MRDGCRELTRLRHDPVKPACVIYTVLAGICALPRVRKQGSPQRHGGTEQKSQAISLIFFSVSPYLYGDHLLQMVIKGTNFPDLIPGARMIDSSVLSRVTPAPAGTHNLPSL
jgi:hypothetical protein